MWLIFVPKILDVTDDVHFDGCNLAHQKHGSTPQLWLIFVPKILDATDDVHFDGRNLAHQKHGSPPRLWLFLFVSSIPKMRLDRNAIFQAFKGLITDAGNLF
ncbi:MAG: hypothetical protein LIR22_06405, partial [Bacillota bacterium]|nr:hypothetical protein [Bacillota bacterium]